MRIEKKDSLILPGNARAKRNDPRGGCEKRIMLGQKEMTR